MCTQLWPGQEAGNTDTELPPEEQRRLGRKRKVRPRHAANSPHAQVPELLHEAVGALVLHFCDYTRVGGPAGVSTVTQTQQLAMCLVESFGAHHIRGVAHAVQGCCTALVR